LCCDNYKLWSPFNSSSKIDSYLPGVNCFRAETAVERKKNQAKKASSATKTIIPTTIPAITPPESFPMAILDEFVVVSELDTKLVVATVEDMPEKPELAEVVRLAVELPLLPPEVTPTVEEAAVLEVAVEDGFEVEPAVLPAVPVVPAVVCVPVCVPVAVVVGLGDLNRPLRA